MNPPPLPPQTWSQDEVTAYLNQPFLIAGKPVPGTEGMSIMQIEDEILRGGRFRVFLWNFSVSVVSFQRGTGVRFIRSNEGPGLYAWPWTLLSALVGWWGFPWGIFFTIHTFWINCMGGRDVTPDLLASVTGPERAASVLARAAKPRAGFWLWLLRSFILMIPVVLYALIAWLASL